MNAFINLIAWGYGIIDNTSALQAEIPSLSLGSSTSFKVNYALLNDLSVLELDSL